MHAGPHSPTQHAHGPSPCSRGRMSSGRCRTVRATSDVALFVRSQREVTSFVAYCAQDWDGASLFRTALLSVSGSDSDSILTTPVVSMSERNRCTAAWSSCAMRFCDGVPKLTRWHSDQVLRGYRYHRLFSGDEHTPSLATVVDRPFEPTQLAVELLLSHPHEVVVFVAIEIALRRVVCFLRLRTLPVRLTLRLSVDSAHSDVALCRHLNRGEPVGTTLCFCVSTGNGDALERTEEPRNRAAVMPPAAPNRPAPVAA